MRRKKKLSGRIKDWRSRLERSFHWWKRWIVDKRKSQSKQRWLSQDGSGGFSSQRAGEDAEKLRSSSNKRTSQKENWVQWRERNEVLETQRNKKKREESQEDIEKIKKKNNKKDDDLRKHNEKDDGRREGFWSMQKRAAEVRKTELKKMKREIENWKLSLWVGNQFLTTICKKAFCVSFLFVDCLYQTRVGRPTFTRCHHHRTELEFIFDVTKTTHTNLDVLQESVSTYWNVGDRTLSDSCDGIYEIHVTNVSEGHLTKIQAINRPDYLWPDIWIVMSKAAKKERKARMDCWEAKARQCSKTEKYLSTSTIAMKIPDAKAAVEKEWEKLEKIPAWQLDKWKARKMFFLHAQKK